MKMQTLAVIFVIIMLPISLVLSVYTQNQMTTLNLQSKYDSRLIDSTYEAIKTFQLNTLANSSSDVASSKIRDIEASVNSFYSSVADNFGLAEYNADTIKEYIPAIVYTLYDGYYIYSPYTNNINDIKVKEESSYQNKQTLQGLKPYVYYSCRYKVGNDSDFVITYTLDSYITIQGRIKGKNVNKSGYLLDNISINGNTVKYRNIEISSNENLQEYIVNDENGNTELLSYVQKDGVKYYLTKLSGKDRVFSVINGKRIYLTEATASTYIEEIRNNKSAFNYYKKAKEFTEWVRSESVLKNLTFENAVSEDGNSIKDANGQTVNGLSGNFKIFDVNTSIEDTNSNFNEHRTAVIRYSIQKNLANAIANFNKYSSSTNEFQMPNLSEEDWYSLINNVSCISFLQGLPIGGKIYNGYAVVNNNKTQEFISKESIYIVTSSDEYYHRVNENDLNKKSNLQGIFNVDFERKVYSVGNTKAYVYPHNQVGSYSSVVTQTEIEPLFYENENTYLSNKTNLAKAYYTALGIERYSMYRVSYDNYINFNSNQ